MVIFDSNIFIYFANGTLDRSLVGTIDVGYASITRIETLGFTNITAQEQGYLKVMLDGWASLALNDTIIERAVSLRQMRKMGLGDAIVAATALENNCELWTANTKDFEHIEGLKLHNPLANS